MRESENLSKFELYEFLREELTASLFEKTAVAGINSGNATLITPNRYWQLFLQFNQRARIEAFPVMVDDLLAEVKNEPSEAELNSVYQQGSGLPSFKGSARPGFMRRYQGNVEFVSASIDKFLEPEKAKITPEQIQKAYDERVKEGRYQVPVTSESGTGVQAPDAGSPPSPGATEGTESARPPAVENPGAPNPQNSQSSSKVPSAVKLVSFEQAGDAANPVSIQTPATNATSPASSNSAEVTTLPGTGTATQEPATVPQQALLISMRDFPPQIPRSLPSRCGPKHWMKSKMHSFASSPSQRRIRSCEVHLKRLAMRCRPTSKSSTSTIKVYLSLEVRSPNRP